VTGAKRNQAPGSSRFRLPWAQVYTPDFRRVAGAASLPEAAFRTPELPSPQLWRVPLAGDAIGILLFAIAVDMALPRQWLNNGDL
jgi:hypothetical protein